MAVRKLEDQSQKGKSFESKFDRPRTFKSIKYFFLGEMMFGPNVWMFEQNVWMSGSQFRSVVWSLIIFYLNSLFSILLIEEIASSVGV